jgi:glycosyltransferase involved in cell wall biosynthesis
MRRVVHVVGRMHRAGVETWLMQVVRRSERQPVRHDFLVHASGESAYDAELTARGCRIYRVEGPRRSFVYPASLDAAFRRILADGPVHAAHAHEQLWCGLILEAARRAAIPIRIAHSHNDTLRLERFPNIPRAAFGTWMRGLISRAMTHGLSCSALAAPSLFGRRWRRDPRVRLHYYGLDFTRFSICENPTAVRSALGIPAGRKVVAHIGRCEPQKNQHFLLRIFEQSCRLRSDLHLLLVGEGALEAELKTFARQTGLSSRITWLRNRPDIPEILVSASDLFLLPSIHEGLPLVLLEAQAAGLPCLFSSEITQEADLFPDANAILSCRRPPADWARELAALLRSHRPDRAARLELLTSGPFSVTRSADALTSLYHSDPPAQPGGLCQQEACS